MSSVSDSLKSPSGKPHTWLATEGFSDRETYAQLAKPEVMAAVKQAGITHVLTDLPDMISFENDKLLEGRVTPDKLAETIGKSVTYGIYSQFYDKPVSAETIAAIMINAKEAGVKLGFTSSPTLSTMDGSDVRASAEADLIARGMGPASANPLGDVFNSLRGAETEPQAFMRNQIEKRLGRAGDTINKILRGHDEHLTHLGDAVSMLPPDAKTLIIHQGNLPLSRDVSSALGDDKVERVSPNVLSEPTIQVNLPSLDAVPAARPSAARPTSPTP